MEITYSPYHRWFKDCVPEPETLFGDKNRKRILSTTQRTVENGVSYVIAPLDEAFLDWFTPLYITTISSKPNPVIHDIFAATLGNPEKLSTYFTLTIVQHNQIVGGTIFGVRSDKIMIAYKAYAQKWFTGTLQANPTLYSEYVLTTHAYELSKKAISHGKDRNPYGPNASIGLAIFKLSVGYKAYTLEDNNDYLPQILDSTSLSVDTLVLHFPSHSTHITEATLFAHDPNNEKYQQLFNYPELLLVHVEALG